MRAGRSELTAWPKTHLMATQEASGLCHPPLGVSRSCSDRESLRGVQCARRRTSRTGTVMKWVRGRGNVADRVGVRGFWEGG